MKDRPYRSPQVEPNSAKWYEFRWRLRRPQKRWLDDTTPLTLKLAVQPGLKQRLEEIEKLRRGREDLLLSLSISRNQIFDNFRIIDVGQPFVSAAVGVG